MTHEKTHIDLFSGLGGFAIAARAAGIRTVQFCEIDARCRDFLRRAWPGVPVHDDVRTLFLADTGQGKFSQPQAGRSDGTRNDAPRPSGVYLLTAGVPCQPASRAGKQRGASDDRWLWPEAIRVLSAVRPTWALFENPPGIGDVGLAGILADLEAQDYQVSVVGIPACAVGAPHQRMRYWIVARRMADDRQARRERAERCGALCQPGEAAPGSVAECADGGVADAGSEHGQRRVEAPEIRYGQEGADQHQLDSPWSRHVWLPCADGKFRRAPACVEQLADGVQPEVPAPLGRCEATEILAIKHRSLLGALGNSIVWPVAAEIIKAMVEADEVNS